ncbi:MAG: hypothetical protein ACFCU2_12680 [Acidimicrobiia bacterium]
MDIDTLARHHAERARESLATAVPPPIPITSSDAPSRISRIPGPVWAALAAIAVLVVLGLPYFIRDAQVDQQPVTIPESPEPTIPGIPEPTVPEGAGGGFVPTGPLNSTCAFCEAILLDDGRVLVLGPAPEIYDHTTRAFTTVDAPGTMVSGVVLEDSRALITDGAAQWLFDPATDSFQEAGAVAGWEMARLGDGRVLLLGDSREAGRNETFLFDPGSGATTQGPATIHSYGNGGAVMVSLRDGRVLLLGSTDSEIFDPATQMFNAAGKRMDRGGFTATLLSDGRVLIAGDQVQVEPYDVVNVAEIFDPVTGEFTPTGEMNWGRVAHAAALLADGRVLVVGGTPGDLLNGIEQAEFYDPSTGGFQPVPFEMTRKRVAPVAVSLADGAVLILGHYPGNLGQSSAGSLTAELFILGRQVDEDEGSVAENPTEVEVEASFDLGSVFSGEAGSTELSARLVVPPGSLEGMREVSTLVTLDMEGEPSTGTITVEVGAPFDQVLTRDLSEGSGGSGGGGEVTLTACDTGCDMTIPVTVSWTGDGTTVAFFGIRLQIGYTGREPDAAEGVELTIVAP